MAGEASELRPRLRRSPWDPYEDERSLGKLAALVWASLRLIWQASPRQLALMVGLLLFSAAASGASILVIRNVVAALLSPAGHRHAAVVWPQVIFLGLVLALVSFTGALQRQLRLVVAELVQWEVSQRLLDVTVAVDLKELDRPAFLDQLERALNSQGRPFQLSANLLAMAGSAFQLISLTSVLFFLQPLLAPIVLVALLPMWLSSAANSRAFRDWVIGRTASERRRGYLSWILTYPDRAKEVRAFRLEMFLRPIIRGLFDERLVELKRIARRGVGFAAVGSLASSLAVAGTIGALVALVIGGGMNLAAATAAAAAVIQLGPSLSAVAGGIADMYEGALFVDDYQTFLALAPVIEAARPRGPVPPGFERLLVEDVTFTYPDGERAALRSVSLELRRGEIVALVGENGSGKTTLAKLLCGLYAPDSGRICWDEHDTALIDPHELRKRVSIIFQDFGQYWLSAAQNIGIGAVERMDDRDAIVAASRHAGSDEFIAELREGYATMLGRIFEGGAGLSIGQWQRLALARAFLRDADLIILDEPTAALDARAEHAVFESIRSLCQGRTVLLISHRFSSVRSADRIYVLKEGQVVERGSHDELMTLAGLYAELFSLQAAAYVEA